MFPGLADSSAFWSLAAPGQHGPGDQRSTCPAQGAPHDPPQALADTVIGLHPTCTYPGCTRIAQSCDLDHIVPYATGGTTCLCNLHPLCRRHHRLKTYGHWKVRFTGPDEPYPAGTIEWISRKGLRHLCFPEILPGSNGWAPPSPTQLGPLHPPPGAPPVRLVRNPEPETPETDEESDAEAQPTRAQRRAQRLNRWRRDLNRLDRPHTYRRHPGIMEDLDDPYTTGPASTLRSQLQPTQLQPTQLQPPPIDQGEPPF